MFGIPEQKVLIIPSKKIYEFSRPLPLRGVEVSRNSSGDKGSNRMSV